MCRVEGQGVAKVLRFSDGFVGFVGATPGESSKIARGANCSPVFAHGASNAKHYHQSADGATLSPRAPTCGQFLGTAGDTLLMCPTKHDRAVTR